MSKKILLILIFLDSCSFLQRKTPLCLDLDYINIEQLSKDRVTEHLRHSFDLFGKIRKDGSREDGLYVIYPTLGVPNKDQLPLIKEKFLMLEIKEEPFPPSLIKKGINPKYDKLVADFYNKAYVTILISPEKMQVWKLWLWPIGVAGYNIEKIEELSVTSDQRKRLEEFRSSEYLKYWW